MREVLVIVPFVDSSPLVAWMRDVYSHVSHVDIVGVDEGKDPLVTVCDIEFNNPAMLKRILRAQEQGYRAAVIACFGDPVLTSAREMASIPVFGPGETALAVATTLGDRILIVEPGIEFVYATQKNVRMYGLDKRVVGVRSVPLDFCSANATPEEAALGVQACVDAVREEKAHVLVLGCIGLCGFVDQIRQALGNAGLSVSVVEPGITVMEYSKMVLGLGLNQSRAMFHAM
ncbi:MAG: aspartate/glutamate racemase family protein [Deltaproteobacteria bacterium]|nr:aspartate/glutamate racemase family protein [Deltaproteobacteria bacterium]